MWASRTHCELESWLASNEKLLWFQYLEQALTGVPSGRSVLRLMRTFKDLAWRGTREAPEI